MFKKDSQKVLHLETSMQKLCNGARRCACMNLCWVFDVLYDKQHAWVINSCIPQKSETLEISSCDGPGVGVDRQKQPFLSGAH